MRLRNKIYYRLKPFLPRRVQITLRREVAKRVQAKHRDTWPIDESAAKVPENWPGWPDGKQFALVLTHDVESGVGVNKCRSVAELEKEIGFRSSFNFVIKDYDTPGELRQYLAREGFEVGIHGYTHDGRFFHNKEQFMEKAPLINKYLEEWGAVGYRTPAMLSNLEWILNLNLQYDLSTFDTDPFEPQPYGARTIFPFWVGDAEGQRGFVEMPYTLVQDFTLFVILQENSAELWKKKLKWIAEKGGMALLNAHPDYMCFDNNSLGINEYRVGMYREFLEYVATEYEGKYWNGLAKDVAAHFRKNYDK